jgi:hypothetical protein
MSSIRIGFSTDFNLVNEQVGIGTTNPTARLDVRGDIRADNTAGGGGISTISRYDGFLNKTQSLPHNVSIAQTTKGNLNSLSGEIVIDGEITVEEGTALTGGRLDSLTVTGTFDIPHGGSEDREETPEKGSTRFNQDLGQLEFYTGLEWRTTASYDGSGRGRIVIYGGSTGAAPQSYIHFINTVTQGNSINFGSAGAVANACDGVSDSTRGVFYTGYSAPGNGMEYVTLASEGNSIDFGDLSVARYRSAAHSSSTRGLNMGGRDYPAGSPTNIIDYIQIQTLGSALDFGDLYRKISGQSSGMGSPTRAFAMAGYSSTPVSTYISDIQTVTISSKGDAIKFGDLVYTGGYISACSNSIRGFAAGGYQHPGSFTTKHINTVTLSTTGNATSFGDLSIGKAYAGGGASNTRGFYFGGISTPPTVYHNVIEFWNITTSGNAQDFGDMPTVEYDQGVASDSHGGLGGF